MKKILVPVDGSDNALRAVEYLLKLTADFNVETVHLVNIQDALHSLEIQEGWTAEQCAAARQRAGDAALSAARRRLDTTGIPYTAETLTGPVALTIVNLARELKCDLIVMGTRGMGAIGNLLMGSVAGKVVQLTDVPVMLVK